MPHDELFASMVARLRSWREAAESIEIMCNPEELTHMRRAIGRADLEQHQVAVVVDAEHHLTLRFTDGFVGTFLAGDAPAVDVYVAA